MLFCCDASGLDPHRLELELEELIKRSSQASQSKEISVLSTDQKKKPKLIKAKGAPASSRHSKYDQVASSHNIENGVASESTISVKRESSTVTKGNVQVTSSTSKPLSSPEERVRSFIKEHQNQRTSKAYATGWAGFASYLTKNGIAEEAITSAHIADYLSSRWRDQGKTASTICGDRAAIAYRLKQVNKSKLMEDRLVVDTMNLVRQKASQSKPKRHMSAELMAELIRHHEEKVSQTKSVISVWRSERNICLMLFMMMGMLRESEATSLKTTDVEIRTEVVKGESRELVALLVNQSKTDQAGVGAVVLLDSDPMHPSHCPVARLRAYIGAATAAGMNDKRPMFPTEQGEFMKPSTPCGIIQRIIQSVNEVWAASTNREHYWGEPKEYGSHSMRRGGVTTARENGVPMLDIQRHGRWRSLSVFDYVGLSTEDKLVVSNKFLANVATTGSMQPPTPMKDSTIPAGNDRVLSKASITKAKVENVQGEGKASRKRKEVSSRHQLLKPSRKKMKVERLLRKVPVGDRSLSISSLQYRGHVNELSKVDNVGANLPSAM